VAVVVQLAVRGDAAAARREAERTVGMAVEGGWLAHETIAIANRSLLAGTGSLKDAVQACRDGVRLGLDSGLPHVVGVSYVSLLFCLVVLTRFPEAVEVTSEALGVARRLGLSTLTRLQIAANGADALILLGRWDESDRLISSVAGEPSAIVDWLNRLPLANTAILRGVLDEHAAELERVVEAGAGMAGQLSDWAHALAAELALLRGNVGAVRSHADAVLASSGPASWRSVTESQVLGAGLAAEARAAALARLEGDAAGLRLAKRRAATYLSVVERLLTELPDDFRLPRLYLATAVAEATRLDGIGDASAWRTAADGWAAASVPYWEARCRLGEAEALGDRALDQPRATALLQAAHATATSLGARRIVADAEAAAARARLSLLAPPEPRGEPDVAPTLGLSSREREVLSLVAVGMTNREIGDRLVISPKTAGVHVSNILAKLGARGRIEAASIARRAGIL
jgi:DNA-binding CsgD family transcriptional regulator